MWNYKSYKLTKNSKVTNKNCKAINEMWNYQVINSKINCNTIIAKIHQ